MAAMAADRVEVEAMLREAGLTPGEIAAYLRMIGHKRKSNPKLDLTPSEAAGLLVVRYGFRAADARRALASWGVRSGGRYSRSSILAIGRRKEGSAMANPKIQRRAVRRSGNPTYGTSYFVSRAMAVRYYRPYEGRNAEAAVDRKLREGEIHLGAPHLKAGEKLIRIDGGTRFAIQESNPQLQLPRQWTPARVRIGPGGKVQVGFTAAQARKINPSSAYDVYLHRKRIDTVFYNKAEPVADVKRSLVNHDGYDPEIVVKKQRKRKASR